MVGKALGTSLVLAVEDQDPHDPVSIIIHDCDLVPAVSVIIPAGHSPRHQLCTETAFPQFREPGLLLQGQATGLIRLWLEHIKFHPSASQIVQRRNLITAISIIIPARHPVRHLRSIKLFRNVCRLRVPVSSISICRPYMDPHRMVRVIVHFCQVCFPVSVEIPAHGTPFTKHRIKVPVC